MNHMSEIEVEVKLEEIKLYIEEVKQKYVKLPCGCVIDSSNQVRFVTCVKHFLYGAR